MEILNSLKYDIISVRGNCDSEVDQMVLEFPLMNTYELIEADDLVLFATHGHVYSPSSPPPFVEFDVMLNGHTHISALEDMGCILLRQSGFNFHSERRYGITPMRFYENGCFTLHRLRDGAETGRMKVEKKII